MSIPSVIELVQALREHGLLSPAQLLEVAQQLQPCFTAPQPLAQELVQRGWLTVYQREQLLQGQGRDLLLSSYLLLEPLGRGGMGQVFKARDLHENRLVALKMIRKDRLENADARFVLQAVRRFRRESKAGTQLEHPNIVTLYDAGQINDLHYLAMEYIDGSDLNHLVESSPSLSVAQACDCVCQAARGLQHAYERGLVHRDIKPSNLMLATEGAVVKILDFGLVRLDPRLADDETNSELTQSGVQLGSVDYMAPEQALDPHQVDIRADIYSLGCTLYYLLTRQVLYPGGTPWQKRLRHQQADVPDVTIPRPDAPRELAAVLRRMLAKRPEERYQTPAEVAAALAPFLSDTGTPWPIVPTRAGPAPPTIVQPKPSRKQAPVIAPVPPTTLGQWLKNSIGMEFVLIPSGKFLMGSPASEQGRDDDEQQHEVEITQPFYLGVYAVTQEEYERVMGQNPSWFSPSGGGKRKVAKYQTKRFPVESVSWHDALRFCSLLAELPEEKNAGRTYRLPTEAEWEYACRGEAHAGTPFHAGSSLSSKQANFNGAYASYGTPQVDPYLNRTTTVGSYGPNAFGLYDMHGNVWEWCADWYDENYYQTGPQRDPPGPPSGTHRVLRGGSWVNKERDCRTANRYWYAPVIRNNNIGFRVVVIVAPRAS
jgi:formylglycine-generating enzyme required for sulfatase activity